MCSKKVKVNLSLFFVSNIYALVQASDSTDPRISAVEQDTGKFRTWLHYLR
jgi:hypothetical protein